MNLTDLVRVAPLVTPGTKSKATLDALTTLGASFLVSKAADVVNPMEWVALAQGHGAPSKSILFGARTLQSVLSQDKVAPHVVDFVFSVLAEQGITEEAALTVLKPLAGVIAPDLQVTGKESVGPFFLRVSENVISCEGNQPGQVYVCPDCSSVRILR